MQHFWYAIKRNYWLSWVGGAWLGYETLLRVPLLKGLAPGWKFLSWFGIAFLNKTGFSAYNSHTYGPIVSAYFRKYSTVAKSDKFEITDRKREYFDIDTSSYMKYDFKDLDHHLHHANNGPQPVFFNY